MTYEEWQALLDTTGIPFTFDFWENPPQPPYGAYYDDRTENFYADDKVYAVIKHFTVELYESQRSEATEAALEAVLDGAELDWEKNVEYLRAPLRLYQVTYDILEV